MGINNFDNLYRDNPVCNNIEISALRILLKKFLYDEPVFFNVESGKNVPVDICIKNGFQVDVFEAEVARILLEASGRLDMLIENNEPTSILINENEKIANLICSLKPEGNDPVESIVLSKLILYEKPEEKIICSHKVKLIIKFIIALLLKFSSGAIECIVMPGDEGSKFCYGNNVSFPIEYKNYNISKTLEIDKINGIYVLEIEVPISSFDETIPIPTAKSENLDSRICIKNMRINTDILSDDCRCNDEKGTHVTIEAAADIIDKLGIYQNIIVGACPINM